MAEEPTEEGNFSLDYEPEREAKESAFADWMGKLREAYEGELHFNYKRVDKVNPKDAEYYTEDNLKAFLAQKDSLDAQVCAYQMIQLKRLNGGSRTVEQAYKKLISWMDVKSATMVISKLTIASDFLPPMECEVEAKQRGRY